MDESLTAVWVRGNLVNQQCLSVSDRDSSPSVPQQGILCGDSNMLETPVRDNRPLNVFDVQPHEALSMFFSYEQEMTDDGLLSKGASEESTASTRCPSAPSSVECTDQPSGASTLIKNKKTEEFLANNGSDATDIHSYSVVKLTCKNAIIQCLQHKTNILSSEIFRILSERFPGKNGKPKYSKPTIQRTLSLHKETFVHEGKPVKSISHKSEYWHLKEHKVDAMNDSVVVGSIDNNPVCAKDPEVPDCKNKTFTKILEVSGYKNEVIECLRFGKQLSLNELCENINRRRKSRNFNKEVCKKTVTNVLTQNHGIFKNIKKRACFRDGRWSMRESVKNKSLSLEGLDSIAPINSIDIPLLVSDVEIDTYSAMARRCFAGGKVLTLLEVYAAVLEQHSDINEKRPSWKTGIYQVLKLQEYFQWSQSYDGVSNKKGFWRMVKSMNKPVESDESLKSLDVAPPFPIIQPRLSPIASGEGASAMATPMDQSVGMVSIDHDNELSSERLCRSEEGGSLGTHDESLINEGQYFAQEHFLLLQQILESEVGKTQTIEEWLVEHGGGVFENESCNSATCSDTFVQQNNLERISGDEFIECVKSGEKLTHTKYDENMEEQNSYINKNEHGYFDEYLKSESKELVAASVRNPSAENENNLGGEARPDQFGCILGSPLIFKGYNGVNLEQEDL